MADDDAPQRFATLLRERFGDGVLAVVLYGSYLRGKRDTVLDFYVLLDDYTALHAPLAAIANRLLPPNVYHLHAGPGIGTEAAKFATVTLSHFERAIARGFHPYFWARFAQPVMVLHVRDDGVRTRLDAAARSAARRMIEATVPLLGETFTTTDLWRSAFTLTYGCELRSEDPARGAELVTAYGTALEVMTGALAAECGLAATTPGHWRRRAADPARARRAWWARRALGKWLSVARLFKAAFTFNEPLDYILWKVERHSGVRVEASALQRRHPLLFGWPVLWRLYRRGGFR
ncbi:MAG: hypothetical protein AB7Q81_04585 [Gammaproteobacteria bacterium]